MASALGNTFHSLYTQVSSAYEKGELLSSAINTAKELDTQKITVIALTTLAIGCAAYKVRSHSRAQGVSSTFKPTKYDGPVDDFGIPLKLSENYAGIRPADKSWLGRYTDWCIGSYTELFSFLRGRVSRDNVDINSL